MKLKIKYTIWILLIHATLAVSSYYAIQSWDKMYLIILLELMILISLGLSFWFYSKLQLPKEFIKHSKQILVENDFNIQYLKTDNTQLNELYEVFNAMINKIIMERRFSEEQNYFLLDVIKASPTGIILLDYDNKIELINPKAKECLHLSENHKNQLLSDIDTPIQFDLEAKQPIVVNIGGSQKLQYSISPFYYRGFHRKMITIHDLHHEIQEAEKASYSKVIRMMAHEINNSIGPINSILNTVKDEYPHDELINQVLTTAIHRTEALNTFMQNFATVVRLPPPTLQRQNIIPAIQVALKLLEPSFQEKNIQIYQDLPTELLLQVDIAQMEQVFINILKNSIQSIDNQGIIKISAQPDHITIRDNGQGIAPENADLIFSPFFTTKPNGQGVGLTLTKRILTGHHFAFSLKTMGDWTEFWIGF